MASAIYPVTPKSKIKCARNQCGKVARWREVAFPVVVNRVTGPFFYSLCGQHKRGVSA